jgi:GNAT superfamily N-acetyltransferase
MSSEGIEIELHECASASPAAIELCLRGWNELFVKGLTDGRLVFHAGMSAMVARVANGRDMETAGVLLFGLEPEFKRCWVTLSYVREEYRARGIYTAMYEAMRGEAKRMGVRSIESATHVRNVAMRAVAKRQGRAEDFVILIDRLEQ